MKITSPAFEHNDKIPKEYTCDGLGVNPPLQFIDVPPDTKSLALIVDDPDAPSGDFVHWVVYNIDADARVIGENNIPEGGEEGQSSTGEPGYVAPCPPTGEHRYIFNLYALDTIALDLPGTPTKEAIEKAMQGHILSQAELIGLYQKQ